MPRRADTGKLVPLSGKVPSKLRAELVKAAKKSGRSLSSELAHCIERQFDYDKLVLGDREAAPIQQLVLGERGTALVQHVAGVYMLATEEGKRALEERVGASCNAVAFDANWMTNPLFVPAAANPSESQRAAARTAMADLVGTEAAAGKSLDLNEFAGGKARYGKLGKPSEKPEPHDRD